MRDEWAKLECMHGRLGDVNSLVNHLGILLESGGSCAKEISERIRKADISWRTLGRVWHNCAIALPVRLM
eukprot:16436928-Heterocapsa_arctica.AAC.1